MTDPEGYDLYRRADDPAVATDLAAWERRVQWCWLALLLGACLAFVAGLGVLAWLALR